jgi:glutathione synthase/RimK-type ligase-like ATP-grasp enzyme
MTRPVVLLLTHSGDYYTIDLVEAAVAARGGRPLRINTDTYPTQLGLTVVQPGPGHPRRHLLSAAGQQLDLDDVTAIWARRLWPGKMPAEMDPQMAVYSKREARTAFFDTFSLVEARWVNPLQAMLRAESKILQLQLAEQEGLTLPPTLITSDPHQARAFWEDHDGKIVTKLLGALSQTMNATGDFMYTSRVTEDDLEGLDGLRYCPQVFQGEIDKAAELRCIVVGDDVFVGAINASSSIAGRVDWRKLTQADGVAWEHAELPADVKAKLVGLTRRLGLIYGAADLIVTPDGDHVFLEVNPAGEWGWLQRDLGLPIAEAIADALLSPAADARDTTDG